MSKTIALVRKPGHSFVNAISEHPNKGTINFNLACQQHQQYVKTLIQLGVEVIFLDPLKNSPDSVFVEDTAILIEEVAFLCSLKEESRKNEVLSVLQELKKFRKVEVLRPPIFMDGGDILQMEDMIFIGLSRRTNKAAVEFFQSRLSQKVVPVKVINGLHLKSAVTYLGKNFVLVNPLNVNTSVFSNFNVIETVPREQYASNCLALGGSVILPKDFPLIAQVLRQRGWDVLKVSMSEFEKADGGITCLSLIIP